jgi:hypothetical protein
MMIMKLRQISLAVALAAATATAQAATLDGLFPDQQHRHRPRRLSHDGVVGLWHVSAAAT